MTKCSNFTHLTAHSHSIHARLTYWLSPKNKEVDLIVELNQQLIPFEIKYQSRSIDYKDIQGLTAFCSQKSILEKGFIVTKSPNDIGPIQGHLHLMRIPASMLCYWLGESELKQTPFLMH